MDHNVTVNSISAEILNLIHKKNIKVEITHGYIEEKKERQKTEIQKENEKYSFISDKSLPLEEVVSRFISIEYDKNIPTERVDDYMNLPLTELLNKEREIE